MEFEKHGCLDGDVNVGDAPSSIIIADLLVLPARRDENRA